jgi:uncharacterized protein (TIGR02001 family)
MKKHLLAFTSLALLGTAALPLTAQADLSGNVGVVSQYILRGITNSPENSNAAIQGGFDWSDDSGLYAGYWGSNLGYNSSPSYTAQGFENDFYGGYSGKAGDLSYSAGLIGYYYVNVAHSNGVEFHASADFGPMGFGMNTLLNDVAWGNKGDTYLTLSASHDLPKSFSAKAVAGYYIYKDKGEFITSSATKKGFRHLDLSLSHPIAKTGADMTLTYTIGGKDRDGNSQDNAMTLGFAYAFDL